LPLTLDTLQEWKSEKEATTKKKAIAFNYHPVRQFRYQLNNNRLWFRGKEITEKEVNERGKNVFRWKGPGESKDWIYLEVALEKNYQLRAYCQEKKGDDIHCYQSYFSYKKKNLVNISFYLPDEISKILAKKRKKKAAEGEDIPAIASPISQSLLKNLADAAWSN
jgi:hypothetical protein